MVNFRSPSNTSKLLTDSHFSAAKQADHFANIRTNTLLAYLGLNGFIVIFFSSTIWTRFLATYSSANPPVNYYNVGIFWSVAVLSAIRFLGSTLYLVLRLVGF